MVLGQFRNGRFPDGQFPEDIYTTDSSPKDSFPNGQFPERAFPRRTVPRMAFSRVDIFATDTSPNHIFHIWKYFFPTSLLGQPPLLYNIFSTPLLSALSYLFPPTPIDIEVLMNSADTKHKVLE